MNFKTTNAPENKWCVVETPQYCESGYHIAKWNGKYWESDTLENLSEYVEGWQTIE